MIRLFNVYYPTRTIVLLLCEGLGRSTFACFWFSGFSLFFFPQSFIYSLTRICPAIMFCWWG